MRTMLPSDKMVGLGGTMPTRNSKHLIHLAHQIIAQLPEDEAEALQTLRYATYMLLHPPLIEAAEVTLRIVRGD